MAMAIIALSCCSSPIPTNKLLHSSLSPSPSSSSSALPFPHNSLNLKRPVLSICRSQFDGSAREKPEATIDEESFFDKLVEEEESDEEDDETEEESSVDLLIRFLHSMFKKLSKRAKKASRHVLPAAISPQLVSFSVDGVLLLAALSIVKALLEVACSLGGTVFVVILLLRVIWAAVSYFQSSGNSFNQGEGFFGTTPPVA